MRRAVAASVMAGLFAGTAWAAPAADFVKAVDALQNPTIVYDGSYQRIAYPMGDVAPGKGVCTDVVVRAYRAVGVDLQKLVHQDMVQHFAAYPHPRKWRLTHTDTNIDHRRVPNLAAFFARHGKTLKITHQAADYAPGDIVVWSLTGLGAQSHIGIVTDRLAPSGRPLVMHNIGYGQVMEDVLFAYEISGHFRYDLN